MNASVLNYGESVEKAISEIEEVVGLTGDEMRYHAIKLIENDKRVKEDLKLSPEVVKKVEAIVADLEDELDNDGETIITNSRYDFIGAFMPQVMTRPKTKENLTRTDRIDAVVTNRFFGLTYFWSCDVCGLLYCHYSHRWTFSRLGRGLSCHTIQ